MNSLIKKMIFRNFTVKKDIKNLDFEEKALLIYLLHSKYKKIKIRFYRDASKRLINKGILKVVDSKMKPGNKLVKVSDKYYSALKNNL